MKTFLLAFSVITLSACLLPRRLAAEEGDANPTGISGIYNGNITTAGNYDPNSRNAMRVVDDIVVPGSVGAYPLKWTRYYNSRGAQWTFSYKNYLYGLGGATLGFTDGRNITLTIDCSPGVEKFTGTWNNVNALRCP